VSEEDFARRMEGVTERRELVAHFVGVVPGAADAGWNIDETYKEKQT